MGCVFQKKARLRCFPGRASVLLLSWSGPHFCAHGSQFGADCELLDELGPESFGWLAQPRLDVAQLFGGILFWVEHSVWVIKWLAGTPAFWPDLVRLSFLLSIPCFLF